MKITVEHVDHMGNDDTLVNAARVSMDKEADQFTGEKNDRLIKYPATHNHFTPFTHPMITLRETVPIFVARQRFKHVVGFTYNEVSRRYVDDTPDFYVPDVWRSRPDGSIKQGSGGEHPNSRSWSSECSDLMADVEGLYLNMIEDGVAPEQARMILPQSMMISYYVTGSLAAWTRAYSLRADSHAQVEIQDLAAMWAELIEPLYPVTWKALIQGVQ
jgi:thymidylate synthase (FAD)